MDNDTERTELRPVPGRIGGVNRKTLGFEHIWTPTVRAIRAMLRERYMRDENVSEAAIERTLGKRASLPAGDVAAGAIRDGGTGPGEGE